jgi:hypothetical protein
MVEEKGEGVFIYLVNDIVRVEWSSEVSVTNVSWWTRAGQWHRLVPWQHPW